MASINPVDVATAQGIHGIDLLVAEVDKLVSLPDIYYRLETEIVDSRSTTDSIANLLRTDPDLCARLLRMANSAFYSFPTKIETIETAISTIGLRQIRELVLVTAVIKAFEGIPSATVNMTSFWEHSVAVAIMAREIGSQAGISGADGFFIPGLLHDLGHLVMYLKLPGVMFELLDTSQGSEHVMALQEREMLGYTHADIGGRLLEFWNLPSSIWEPVSTHHDIASAGEFALAASAIHIADAWINRSLGGGQDDEFEHLTDSEAFTLLKTDIDQVERAGGQTSEQVQMVIRQFMNH